jgi:hypothetical protein
MKLQGIIAFTITLTLTSIAFAQSDRTEEISTHQAVETFNQRETRNFKECNQPPLTEKELLGSIQRMSMTAKEHKDKPEFTTLLKIAETETLPPNAYLTVLRGAYTQSHYCDVFDIQVTVITSEKSHLTIPIRQITISSRKIRPEERRERDEKLTTLKTNASAK